MSGGSPWGGGPGEGPFGGRNPFAGFNGICIAFIVVVLLAGLLGELGWLP